MGALLEVISILRRHRHWQQLHSQLLQRQAWTVITTTIAFIIAIAINIKYPVIILLSILPIVANVILAIVTNAIRTRRRSHLLCRRPKVSQACRTRQRSLLLRYAALITTSTGRHQVGIVQSTGYQGTTSSTTKKRKEHKLSGCDNRQEQQSCSLFLSLVLFNPLDGRAQRLIQKNKKRMIRLWQSTRTAILFSFPFVGVVQPTGWHGTTSTTKGKKRTIRLRQLTTTAITERQLTTTAITERQSTTIICHCQEKAITNFVLLSSNWSESILRTNDVENIPPRINLGLECRMIEESISSKCIQPDKNAL
jgi:hypothetical protein